MKVYIIDQPLKPKTPNGSKRFIAPLNIAESKLRALIGEPYSKKVQVKFL